MSIRTCHLAVVAALLTGLLSACAVAQRQPRVEYIVNLEQPQTQMVEITLVLRGLESDPISVKLPTWRPGRYAINDHAGAVQEVEALDGEGEPLAIRKADKSTWSIATGGSEEVRVRYKVYANEARLRTRHVDDTHAFLDASSTMMYLPEYRDEPLRVRVEAPEHWRIATGLEPDPELERAVVAPDYDVLVDSPLEIGEHELIEFEVGGVPHEIVIWGRGDWDQRPLAEDFASIVREQVAIFQDIPYDRYVFMIHSQPGYGGGTEHLNSTIMGARPESFDSDSAYEGFLGLVSHEMFHTWNVKQLRPAGITPYDYQQENYSDLFWFAEGTTSYYDDLTLVRAGLIDVDEYLDRLSGQINSVRSTPGRKHQSLSESSFDAWIKFNASNAHSRNATVNFYSQGAAASLLWDMLLRRASEGRVSLDDLMRLMYRDFNYKTGGFTSADLQTMSGSLTGEDFSTFFARYIHGTDELPLEDALTQVGLELNRDAGEDEGPKAFLGMSLSGGDLPEVSRVDADGPAFAAGLNPGDRIVAINGVALSSGDLDDRVEKHEPGDVLTISFIRHDLLREIDLELASRPAGRWEVSKIDDPTDEQRAAFEGWLGQPWDGGDDEANEDGDNDAGNDGD